MNTIKLNLDKTKKYVVACSFGPDSMALLHSAFQQNLNIVVAHVNYRKREAANYEQLALERFCDERNIKIFVLDLLKVKHEGNFQEWARETRYKFFKKVVEEENADCVLVAHQEDDVIETYLMQKKRGNFVKNYGISEDSEIYGIRIKRPLLGYSKQILKEYDDENNIPYSIDESNLTDCYMRNKIRHNIVDKMDDDDRKEVLQEIKSQTSIDVQYKSIWEKEEFLKLSYEQIIRLFDFYFNKTGEHCDISRKFVLEMKKAFGSNRNCYFDITPTIRVEKDYDDIYLVNKGRVHEYSYEFKEKLKNHLFDIDFSDGARDRDIINSAEKLIVKNIPANSKVIILNYTSNINRVYISWKMPHFLREVWPAVFDKKGTMIYVPRYRKNFIDKHKSKFVFHTEYFTKF